MNKRVAGKYQIKNGVKQGDALSCILFILAVEPLVSNLNCDKSIKTVNLNGIDMPKALAYADDVACIIPPDLNNLQKVFNHYQVMSELSGLKLNADKTEIITSNDLDKQYDIQYNRKYIKLSTGEYMKVNGVILRYNTDGARKKNFSKIYESMVKGENTLESGTPASFDVLTNEIRGLALNMRLEKRRL